MVEVNSQMLALGTEAPPFDLPDADGQRFSLRDAAGSKAYLVMFICNHCPFVKHIRTELAQLGHDYKQRDVAIFAINSNDASSHPGDSPQKLKEESAAWDYSFPYLVDAEQDVAKAYRAACTPDFFVFDADRKLAYRGQLDGSRPGNSTLVDGRDLRAALDALLAGEPIPEDQIPSVGCNIKWIPGQEPVWFG